MDLYQDIRHFVAPGQFRCRGCDSGVEFSSWTSEGEPQCLANQQQFFCYNRSWVVAYKLLARLGLHQRMLVAHDVSNGSHDGLDADAPHPKCVASGRFRNAWRASRPRHKDYPGGLCGHGFGGEGARAQDSRWGEWHGAAEGKRHREYLCQLDRTCRLICEAGFRPLREYRGMAWKGTEL